MEHATIHYPGELRALQVDFYIHIVPPKYEIYSTQVKAEAGTSVLVKFSMVNDPHSGKISPHTLEKEGRGITTAYRIKENEIVFNKVSVEDKGKYTISCQNEAGEGSATFELEVTPPKGI